MHLRYVCHGVYIFKGINALQSDATVVDVISTLPRILSSINYELFPRDLKQRFETEI